jgi:hypothetical protein
MLHRLDLDYCRPPLPLPRGGWALLAAGILAVSASTTWMWRTQAQLAAAESELRVIRRAAAAREPAQRDGRQRAAAADAARANALLRSLDVPWDDLFEAIEAAAHEDIALLRLQPDVQKGTVNITAQARDFAALAAYSAALSGRAPIGTVLLQSHEHDPRENALRFTLVARWKGDAS